MALLRQAGLSYKAIGLKLGVSGQRVHQVMNRERRTESRREKVIESRLLRTAEVARILGIHANTVRRWADDGSLKSYRVGKRGDRRFKREDVEQALS